MIPNLLLPLSDWNAQFFREAKGRFKPRNIAITAASSLFAQALTLLYFATLLPKQTMPSSRYCTGERLYMTYPNEKDYACVLDAVGRIQIDWLSWWSHLFEVISWTLPLVLLVAGVYLLIGDLAKEEKRGTLNFIRLSPQTSQSILIGKLLGVPSLLFLGVVLVLPLHGWAASQAGISLLNFGSFYLITLAACAFFYSGAVFYALLGGAQNWLGAVVILFSYIVLFRSPPSNLFPYDLIQHFWQWYYISVFETSILLIGFTIVVFAIATFWIWQAITRRFSNPNQTLISKTQSYWMTLSFELFIFGFAFHESLFTKYPEFEGLRTFNHAFEHLGISTIVNLFWFLFVTAALSPHRQALLDWARYRHLNESTDRRKAWKSHLIKDLLFGEKSPALVAIAFNLLIPLVLFSFWIMTWDNSPKMAGFLSLLFHTFFVLICAAIAQLALFSPSSKRALLATSLVITLVSLPPLSLILFGVGPNASTAAAWLFSPFAFIGAETTSVGTIALGFLAYLGAVASLSARLTHQLDRAGESQLKALMAQQRT